MEPNIHEAHRGFGPWLGVDARQHHHVMEQMTVWAVCHHGDDDHLTVLCTYPDRDHAETCCEALRRHAPGQRYEVSEHVVRLSA